MAKNPWMAESLSAINRAYYTAAGSAVAQARAATTAAVAAQQTQLRTDLLDMQREMTNVWLDAMLPASRKGAGKSGTRGSGGRSGGSRSRGGRSSGR